MNDFETVLLGTWLRGEHLEDLKYVKESDFVRTEIVRGLKQGKKMLDIGGELRNLSELAEMTTFRSETLYKQSFQRMMEVQIKRDIANMSDLDSIKAKIEYFDSVRFGDAKATEEPAVALAKEIDERANRETIKWDMIPSLNNLTAGIKRKELTAIAARPSVGKSAFALQIAYGAWKQGAKVLYFPLEMSANQSFGRLLVMNKYLTAKEFQTGKIKDTDRYYLGIDHINEMDKSGRFKVYEGEGRIETIESTIKAEKPYLVVIDQLTQMRASVPFKDIRLQFSYMTSNLKRIAMQENVAILILCQINRSADNIKPTMANLKESGSIEEDSDNVILLHKLDKDKVRDPSQYDWENTRPMVLDLAKQRDGDVGETSILFTPSQMVFREVAMI